MIIPHHWAEARESRTVAGKPRTLRRFGWSDESHEAAAEHARQRLDEAFRQAEAGEQIASSDRKVPYNGADGMPIREEIIEQFDDAVITRNSYGALCLNTPMVGFVDIDLPEEDTGCFGCLLFIGMMMGACTLAYQEGSWSIVSIGIVVSTIAAIIANTIQARIAKAKGNDPATQAEQRIAAFSKEHPDWHLRVYRSPNGFRILVMDRLLDPQGSEAEEIFTALDADPMYVRMCQRQACFRARISPKPWRIGIEERMKPCSVWPIAEDRLHERQTWVDGYNQLADGFASCQFVRRLGSERSEPKAELVRAVHDKLCQSDSELPLA